MAPLRWALLLTLLFTTSSLPAQCTNDHRESKNTGILIVDFTITGTQAISATELARITDEMIGSCYNEDSEDIEERVRALFQDRGYFRVEVKSLRMKPRDPLGVPKPVTLEGEVSEGPRYRLGQITFVKNHAFSTQELRQQFPLKKGALMERDKIAAGLECIRKLYARRGYLDSFYMPESIFSSDATVDLNVTVEEGPQYHMGKLEIVAEKEAEARLRAEWKLAEGDVYDRTYIDDYISANRSLLPVNFTRANVQTFQNCPEALMHIRLIVDHARDTSGSEPKDVPCEEHEKQSK
jgi:outer membrane protein assembly factor BamA